MSSCNERLRKGQWSLEEDECLIASVTFLGERRWDAIARATGLKRSGKSCRLRWLNYLQPNLKHIPITVEEEEIIHRLHQKWGNKWARIARRLPGRTDNEIKNYWRGCLRKKTGQLGEQSEDSISNANALHGDSTSLWNSDDDETGYNNVIKEMSLQEDKSEESSPSSGGVSWSTSVEEVPDVIMKPESPYESHFSNWVLLLKSENEVVMGSQCNCNGFQRDDELGNNNISTAALDCWDRLWDIDHLFTTNN